MQQLPRSYWWLWSGLLINGAGTFVLPFLALYLSRSLHYPVSLVGLLLGLFGAGSIAAAIMSGLLADRIGRRPTLLVAQTATAIFTVLLAFSRAPAIMALNIAAFGIAINLSNPAMRAMVADIVPVQRRSRAYALTDWAAAIGRTVAPAIAGLIAAASYRALFFADAATTLVFAFIIYRQIPETRAGAEAATSSAASIANAGKRAWSDAVFLAVVGLNALFALVYFQSQSTLPLVMGRSGLGPTPYGLALSFSSVLVIVLELPVIALLSRYPRDFVLAAGALIAGIGFYLTGFAANLETYLGTVAVWTLGALVLGPFTVALVADLSPANWRGRYQSAYQLSWSTGRLLGPALGLLVLADLGQAVLWQLCLLLGVLTAAGHIASRGARRQRLSALST